MTNDYWGTDKSGNSEGASRRPAWILAVGGFVVACLCLGAIGVTVVGGIYSRHYTGRIYPGVSVYGVAGYRLSSR